MLRPDAPVDELPVPEVRLEVDTYRNALWGIAACANVCRGCQDLVGIAKTALAKHGHHTHPGLLEIRNLLDNAKQNEKPS